METEWNPTILDIDFVVERTYEAGDSYGVAGRTSCRLVFIPDGDATHIFPSGKTATYAGDVLFLPPANDHTVEVGKSGYHFITVSFSVSPCAVPDDLFPIASLHDPGLLYLFSSMYKAYEAKDTGWQMEVKSAVYALLFRFASERNRSHEQERKLSHTIAYMKENYAKKLTLEELAQVSGYSIPHFKKLFRDETGSSPIRYLNDFRIGRAKDLLGSGLFSVQEVAAVCGFENVYYFSNAFKKQTGISPKHYRK